MMVFVCGHRRDIPEEAACAGGLGVLGLGFMVGGGGLGFRVRPGPAEKEAINPKPNTPQRPC